MEGSKEKTHRKGEQQNNVRALERHFENRIVYSG